MFSECKDTAIKTIQNEAQKNANHKNNEMNNNNKNMYRASVTCETIKQSDICVVGILVKLPSKKDIQSNYS